MDRGVKNKHTGEGLVDFFDVSAWSKTAEFVNKYFTKGKEALVQGSMQSRKYEKDGVTRVAWSVRADRVEFCGSKGDGAQGGGYAPAEAGFTEVPDEELPF